MPSPASKRVRLHEGSEGVFFPETRYVVQGHKVCVFEGDSTPVVKNLTESVGSALTLVESVNKLELVERNGEKFVKDGKWFVEGVFQRSDVKNINGRVYPRKLWERILADKEGVLTSLKERSMLGMVEHPADGRTKLDEVGLVVVDLKLNEDGVVWGRSELLDTPKGLILQELTAKKIKWGVSSRGAGSVDENGMVNESDYTVETWDAVTRPSTPGAYPTRVESIEEAPGLVESIQVLETEIAAPIGVDLSEGEALSLVRSIIGKAKMSVATEKAAPSVQKIFDLLLRRVESLDNAITARVVNETVLSKDLTPNVDGAALALRSVVESLKSRMLEEAGKSAAATKNLAETKELLGAIRQKLSEAEKETTKVKRELAAATAAVIALSRRGVAEDDEKDEVQEAISEFPQLERYQGLLESVPKAKVRDAIDTLVREVLESAPATNSVAPVAPRRLLAEAFSISTTTERKTPGITAAPSTSVKLAATAVARLTPRSA